MTNMSFFFIFNWYELLHFPVVKLKIATTTRALTAQEKSQTYLDYKVCWFFWVRSVLLLSAGGIVFTFNGVLFDSQFEGLEFCIEDFRIDILSLLQRSSKNKEVQNESQKIQRGDQKKRDLPLLQLVHTKSWMFKICCKTRLRDRTSHTCTVYNISLTLALWKNCLKQPRGSCWEFEAISKMNCMTTAWCATCSISASFCKYKILKKKLL